MNKIKLMCKIGVIIGIVSGSFLTISFISYEYHHQKRMIHNSELYTDEELDISEDNNPDFSLPKGGDISIPDEGGVLSDPELMFEYVNMFNDTKVTMVDYNKADDYETNIKIQTDKLRYGTVNYDVGIINADGSITPSIYDNINGGDSNQLIQNDYPTGMTIIKHNDAYAIVLLRYIHVDKDGVHKKEEKMLIPKRLERHLAYQIRLGSTLKFDDKIRATGQFSHLMTTQEIKKHIEEIDKAK